MVVITYDENGGRWDHVAPPKLDKWGPGTRVPAIVISPFAKRGFVDHTQYDTTSIAATIEQRWDLHAMESRDAHATPLDGALDPKYAPAAAAADGASPSVPIIVVGALVVLALAVLGVGLVARRRSSA